MGEWDNSINCMQKLLKKSEEMSDNNLMVLALWSASMPHIEKGEWDIAINYCERCLELSPAPVFAAFATGFLGIAYYKGGQLKKGIDYMEKAIYQTKSFGLKQQEVICAVPLGEAYLSISERERALETIKSALDVSKKSGFRHMEGMALRVLGEIYGASEFHKAKKYIEDSINIHKKVGAKNELAKGYFSLGKLYMAKGERVKAKKYVTQALKLFEKLGTLHEPEKAREVLKDLR
jgi:tetratricopeptide (TPR) repeat protein